MLEAIIENYVIEHLESNYVTRNNQHGFGHHCLTNLLDIFYSVYKMHSNERSADIAYHDFQKGFDKISNRI